MRVIAEIPHPTIKITVFQMNQKFIFKLEKGPLEQVFKFSELDVLNYEQLKTDILENVVPMANTRFDEMMKDYALCLS